MAELPRRKPRERRSKRNQVQPESSEVSEGNNGPGSPGQQQQSEKSMLYPQLQKGQESGRRRKIERQRMKIPSKMVGFLIGHRGYSINNLRERTNCEINIFGNKSDDPIDTNNNQIEGSSPDTNNNKNKNKAGSDEKSEEQEENNRNVETVVELIGTLEEISLCKKEIEFLVENGRFMRDSERGIISKSQEKEEVVDMKIPAKVCGMLIGGKGERVNEIMLLTGCEIWVERDESSGSIEAGVATVHLKGLPNEVKNAQAEIRHVLSLFGSAGGKDASRIVFELPNFVGRDIIGVKGSVIRDLQSEYRCSIRIKQFKSNDYKFDSRYNKDIQNTCVVTITGEQDDCHLCKRAIDNLVGKFEKCGECKKFIKEDLGRVDEYMNVWYCDTCWKSYENPEGTDSPTPGTASPAAAAAAAPPAPAAPAAAVAPAAPAYQNYQNYTQPQQNYQNHQHYGQQVQQQPQLRTQSHQVPNGLYQQYHQYQQPPPPQQPPVQRQQPQPRRPPMPQQRQYEQYPQHSQHSQQQQQQQQRPQQPRRPPMRQQQQQQQHQQPRRPPLPQQRNSAQNRW